MGFEIPTDLIRQVQISLRNDAGLSSYDPHPPPLPPLRESVSGFDPSPPNLRCEHCKCRLVRGLQSLICVYCGRRQFKDLPPEPISFKSTFGYRWLLQSLDLNGSETVGPSVEENKFNRGRSRSKDEISLSDLLNIKITLPAESKKTEQSLTNGVPIQNTSSLNSVRVDLDNFFADSKRDAFFNSLEEQPVINRQSENMEMNAFATQTNISLFQNVQHSETAVTSSEVKNGSTFSGWEADFQSADSENQEGSRSFDPFVGSTVDLSAHMDSVFGHGKELEDEKPKDASTPFASATNGGIQDDLLHNLDFSSSHPAELVDATIKSKDCVPENKTISEENDSFDVWNDFTTSTSPQDPSKNSSTQSGNQVTAFDEKTSDIKFSSSTNNFQEMDFGSFSHPGSFNQSGSEEVNNMEAEGPAINRMADLNNGANVGQAAKDGEILNSTTEAKDGDVERVLSQMPDLSFMLEKDLSVPSNKMI
ncbi:hypothetical protein CsSME_00019245 [Camellia sinensis var. sinensis]